MKTEAFENVIRIIDGFINEDNLFLDEFKLSDKDIYIKFVILFSKELHLNLLDAKCSNNEKQLFEYYIWELSRFNKVFYRYSNIIFDQLYLGGGDNWTRYLEDGRIEKAPLKASQTECYILRSILIHESIFHELNLACKTNKLDIFDLCRGLDIDVKVYIGIVKIRKNRARSSFLEYWGNKHFCDPNVYGLNTHAYKLAFENMGSISASGSVSFTPFMKAIYGIEDNESNATEKEEKEQSSPNETRSINSELNESHLEEELYEENENEDEFIKRPKINEDAIPTIEAILKGWFSKKDLKVLKEIISSGKTPSQKLTFRGNGKVLLDFFKQLWKGQLLIIAEQKYLQKWISDSFDYLYNDNKHSISLKYASSVISGNHRAAKGNRLIDVINNKGKFEIVQCELSNRRKS